MASEQVSIEASLANGCCIRSWVCDRYLAGWGYLLSQNAVQLIVDKVDMYEQQPEQAPGWFAGLHWEDVLVGLLLHDYAEPQNRPDGTLAPLKIFLLTRLKKYILCNATKGICVELAHAV